MTLYKGLMAYLVYLYVESPGVVRGNQCEIRQSLFRHCWPRAGLDLFHQWKWFLSFCASDQLGVGNDQKTIDVWESIFIARSLSVHCQSVFHPTTSFPRDLGNGMSFSQSSMPPTSSSSCSAYNTIIDCTKPSKLWAWRSSSKIDLTFGWLRSQEEE